MFSIIIPYHNKPELLKNCLNSIFKQTYEKFEVIIIDNNSVKQIDLLCSNEKLLYFRLEKNVGFSKAINYGISKAKGDFIAILNDDAEMEIDWIERIVKIFEHNKNILFVTSNIKNYKNHHIFDDVGDIILSSGKVHKIGNGEQDKGQYNERRFVFGASGCASAYRRNFFNEIGYFDEDFFAYLEDIDLSFRAYLHGLKCLYVPEAVVYHIGSATSGSQYNKFTAFHLAQNTLNVIVKNYPLGIIVRSVFPIIIHLLMLQVFFITKGLGTSFFKGLISGIIMFKKMLPKREETMKKRTMSNVEIWRMLEDNKKLYILSKSRRVKIL